MLVSFNWLKEFVDIRLKAKELADRLTMAGLEVEAVSKADNDIVLDVNVTPNRGDCLSIMGIAREVSAITGRRLAKQKKQNRKGRASSAATVAAKLALPKISKACSAFITVDIKDTLRCPRYALRIVEGVKIGPSPEWITKRLAACGIRTINNVVDATNYVMIETGQPFHAFDWRNIRGRKVIVKTPSAETEFATLDGIKRKLNREDLLICDNEGPVAIGGVMGGANSEVKPDTTVIVLEAAYFDPVTIRKTAKRLGLASESSRRFERGIDPNATVDRLNRLTDIIVNIAGGRPSSDFLDIYPRPVKPLRLKLKTKDIKRVIGTDVRPGQLKKYFKCLGVLSSGGAWTIPTWRPDLARTIDLIEEIARLDGYDKIPVVSPKITMSSLHKPTATLLDHKAKVFLTSRGFYEAVNLGFASPAELAPFSAERPVMIANPLGVETSAMKTTLLPGLLNNIKHNVNFGQESLRLFELRPVFRRGTHTFLEKSVCPPIKEPKRLCGVMYGMRSSLGWTARQEPVDFYDVKGICEALAACLGVSGLHFKETKDYHFLTASAKVHCGGKEIGLCGMLHPKIADDWGIKGNVGTFELDFDNLCGFALSRRPSYNPVESFPSVRRDVALLLSSDVPSGHVLSAIREFGNSLVKRALPFDMYIGKGIPEGKKSVAYAVWYAHSARTLTDEEVNETHQKMVGFIKDKLGAEIR